MNSEKLSKASLAHTELVPYDASCFAFLEAELDSPKILFQAMATTIAYPVEQSAFEAFISQEHCAPFVLKQGKQIIAYGDIIHEKGKEQRLCRLIVGHEFRGKGYGKVLVNGLIKKALEKDPELPIFLFVIDSNTSAKGCYSSCGFEATGVRFDLQNGELSYPTVQMKYHGN